MGNTKNEPNRDDDYLKDEARLAALARADLFEGETDPSFDRITRLAAKYLKAPIALVVLVESEYQYHKSTIGLPTNLGLIPMSKSICQHVIKSRKPLAIEDARLNPLLSENPAVTESLFVAYLGIPLTLDGEVIGSLCTIDYKPHRWTEDEIETLSDLAQPVITEIRLRADQAEIARQKRLVHDIRLRLDTALEAGAIATWTWDVVANRVFADENLALLFSVSPEEAVGGGLEAYMRAIHFEDRARITAEIQVIVDHGGFYSVEYRVVQPRGSIRWVEARGRGVEDETGKVVSLPGVIVDITDRKRIELELIEVRERLESANTAGSICQWDLQYPIGLIGGDANFAKLFAVEPNADGQFSVEECVDRLHPDDRDHNNVAMTQAFASTGHYENEYRVVTPDRHWRWISSRGSVIYDASGTPLKMRGVTVDITRIKEAEGELKLSEERYRKAAIAAASAAESNVKFRFFFDQGIHFSVVLKFDGTLLEANRQSLDGCGFSRDEVIGRPFWECGWWNGSAVLKQNVENAFREAASGQVFRTETPYYFQDGSLRHADLILAPVKDDEGRILFVAATGADITERKFAEEELQERDRNKDEFLAMLAHELRNPLGTISNGVQLVQTMQKPELLAQFGEMIQRQVVHLTRLIDDLLDVSRITQGKITLRKETVALAVIVERGVELVQPKLSAKHHELTIKLPDQEVLFVADATRAEQILGNLLTNAAKYSESGSPIWLSAELEGDEIVFRVRDTGVGIASEMLPKVFGLFTQVDATIDRSEGGLGIGLTLVKTLVEMHGGSVLARSQGKGTGSEFIVRLPIGSPDPNFRPKKSHVAPALEKKIGNGRVLVVDDNVDSARLVTRMLKHSGFEVQTAYDGIEAVNLAKSFRPAVVLLDIGLPGMNGYEVASTLRGEPGWDHTLLIAISGYGEEKSRERSKAAGFNHHLTKPFDFDDLMSILGAPRE